LLLLEASLLISSLYLSDEELIQFFGLPQPKAQVWKAVRNLFDKVKGSPQNFQ
jgi:hypothetical protein